MTSTTTQITDTASIEALIAGVDERATCKTGMAHARSQFAVILADEDAVALRVRSRLRLQVEARKGTVDLVYRAGNGAERSISAEPAEPSRQALLVSHARRSPVATAVDLLRQDLERIASRAEEIADEAFGGVDENVTLNKSDYAWHAEEALSTYCDDEGQDSDAGAMAAAILARRLAKAQAAHVAENA